MDRKEAIEIIRKNMPSDKSLPVYEALQTLVPELVESEDEKIRQFLLRLVKRCPESSIDFMGEIKKGDVIAWLEKQKEQKWGEDDEKMLARIIERGQSQIQMFETGLLPEHIDWLKSLRPSWKPSEEQPKMNIPSAGSGAMGTTSPKFKLDVKQDLPVGLEKEIQEYLEKLGGGHGGFVDNLIDDDLTGLALHFYALGLKARKEGK